MSKLNPIFDSSHGTKTTVYLTRFTSKKFYLGVKCLARKCLVVSFAFQVKEVRRIDKSSSDLQRFAKNLRRFLYCKIGLIYRFPNKIAQIFTYCEIGFISALCIDLHRYIAKLVCYRHFIQICIYRFAHIAKFTMKRFWKLGGVLFLGFLTLSTCTVWNAEDALILEVESIGMQIVQLIKYANYLPIN